MMMVLRERLALVRHVLGCALVDERGELLGRLGPHGDEAAAAATKLFACARAVGLAGELCFAANMDLAGGQLVARTASGGLLVVRTDGAIEVTSEWVDFLVHALTPNPHDEDETYRSGVRRARDLG